MDLFTASGEGKETSTPFGPLDGANLNSLDSEFLTIDEV
jgi:hypothetical protein